MKERLVAIRDAYYNNSAAILTGDIHALILRVEAHASVGGGCARAVVRDGSAAALDLYQRIFAGCEVHLETREDGDVILQVFWE